MVEKITRRSVFGFLASLPLVSRLCGKTLHHSVFRQFPPGHPRVAERLWYENVDGERHSVDFRHGPDQQRPEGFNWQVSRFPNYLRTCHLRINADGTSTEIMSGESGWSEDLVLALVQQRGYRLGDAIVLVSVACERCGNSMAYALGLSWGYPEGSEQWQMANTECEWCKGSSL